MKRNPLFFLICALVLGSCVSAKNISEDLSAEQLIQMGQNMYGNGQYASAARYYQVAIERYGTDTRTYIESRYELGNVYLKQKKYQLAYDAFKEIESLYEAADAGMLPGAFQKLAKIGLSKIPEKKLKQLQ